MTESEIKHIIAKLSAMTDPLIQCSGGGIGIRARLRGVWETVRVQVPFTALTKKPDLLVDKSGFFELSVPQAEREVCFTFYIQGFPLVFLGTCAIINSLINTNLNSTIFHNVIAYS